MAKVSCYMKVEESMKVDGLKILERGMDMKSMTTTIFIWDTFTKVKLMGRGSTHGLMENTMKESGTWDKNMVLENGKEMEENLILEIGLKVKLMD